MAQEGRPGLLAARGVVAFGVATVGSVVVALAVVWVSSGYLSRRHPQGGQGGLGAIGVGLIALPVAWLVLFFAVRWALGLAASRRN